MGSGCGPVGSFKGELHMQATRYGDLIRARRWPRPGGCGRGETPAGEHLGQEERALAHGAALLAVGGQAPGLKARRRRAQRRGFRQLRAAARQGATLAGGVEPPGADRVHAGQGDMLAPAAEKVLDGKREVLLGGRAVAIEPPMVAVAERHAVAREGDEAVVFDGAAAHVGREVLDHPAAMGVALGDADVPLPAGGSAQQAEIGRASAPRPPAGETRCGWAATGRRDRGRRR